MNVPRVLNKKVAYESPWFKLMAKEISFPWTEKSETYFSVKSLEYCSVLAVTGEGKILLVKQFRPVTERVTLELPSGCVEPGEDPAAAMKGKIAL